MEISEEKRRDVAWARSIEGADALLTKIEGIARECFEKDGYAHPVAVLWTFRDPRPPHPKLDTFQQLVIGTQFTMESGEDKAAFSEFLAATARRLDAFAFAFVSESRILNLKLEDIPRNPGESPEDAVARWRREQPRNFKDIAGYKEVVMVTFEHCAFRKGGCISLAEITREIPGDESSPGTLQQYVRNGGFPGEASAPDKFAKTSGRFAGVLPGARGD
jgi:hypothetical protein